MSQYHVQSNDQNPSGQWTIYADENGTVVGRYCDPNDVRAHLSDIGLDVVTIDGDGNGSIVEIPIAWIGDGEPLVGSKRVCDRIGEPVNEIGGGYFEAADGTVIYSPEA